MVAAAPPRSTALSGALDLYADGDVVLAATYGGISRSVDGGRTWRSVLQGVEMWSITRGPTGFVAIGAQRRRPDRPVVATSLGGRHWQVRRIETGRRRSSPTFGYRAVLDGSVGVAVARADDSWSGGPMLRTTDAGRRWTKADGLPFATGGLQMSASGTIVATAAGIGSACRGAVFSSVDLGRTWSELPGSCSRQPLLDVQFLDARHAVAVGGASYPGGGGQVIETTSDGGLRWRTTRYVAPTEVGVQEEVVGFARVAFVTPSQGFVVTGPCQEGEDLPCRGDLDQVSSAGRRLRRTPVPPLANGWLAVAPTQGGHFVVAGAGRAGPGLGGDGLATGAVARAGLQVENRPGDVWGDVFTGVGSRLLWRTNLGWVSSRDAGDKWRMLPAARADRLLHRPRLRRTGDDVSVGCRTGAVRGWRFCALRSRKDAWVLHRGGPRHPWIGYRMPAWVPDWTHMIVVTGRDRAIFAFHGALWRTTDGGATWRESWPRLPGEEVNRGL
ncbi:MAG TPA: hypothetical protein VME70_04480 [Mycobacteriales bacterium]|nr:hypothetical protein [Mycobacteriales bacterium]